MQFQYHRWIVSLLAVLIVGCGGGSGGGSGGDGAPVIRAWLAAFSTDSIPSPGLGADGGSALLLVTVSDVTAASAAGTVVEANGHTLAYDVTAGAWRGWLLLSTRQRLDLTVRRGTQTWSVGAGLVDVYPQIVSPRQRDNFPTDFVVTPDAVLGRPLRLSWTGELPSADHQWAVMAMDGLGKLSWPAANRFEVLDNANLRRFELPAGAVGNNTIGFVAAGVARSVPITGAPAGSTLTLAAFSTSELFLRTADPGIARLAIAPRWISVGVGRQQPLSALGYSNPATSGPTSMQDSTNGVAWTTDDPNVAVVDADGVIQGVGAGTTVVRISTGSLSAAASVRVLARRTAAPTSDVTTLRTDTAHTGVASATSVSALSAFPGAPRWTAALRGSLSYPLIGDGKIFVLALPWDSNGDSRLRLHALNPATGADAWAGPVILSSFHRRGFMALEGRRLVVVTTDCDVIGLDTTTGAPLWTVNLAQAVPKVWSCDAPPTVRNGIAYVVGAGVDATPTALDVADGRILWAARVPLAGGAPMTLSDDAAYIGSRLQGLKLDALSGTVLWRHSGPGSGGGGSFAVLRDGRVYLDEPLGNESVVLNADGGALQPTKFISTEPPAVTSELIFTTQPASVGALRTANGTVAWSSATAAAVRSPPLAAGGAVLVPLVDGRIEWRDAATGQLWSTTTAGTVGSSGGIELTPGIAVGVGLLVVPMTDRLVVFGWPGS
jgi:outer membrane protein assembly factor BamB